MLSISSALGGDVDVYSIDRRGTGRSTKLDCVAAQAQAASSPGGVSISPEEVASCADELGSKYDADLARFSITSAALDVQYFLKAYLKATAAAAPPVFVYGAGANSPIVERLMHVAAKINVAGYILDGVATTSGAPLADFAFVSKADSAYDAVGQRFLALCGSDSECSKYFPGTTLASAVRSLIQSLEAPRSACAAALDAQLAEVFDYTPGDYPPAKTFRWLLGGLLREPWLRTLIPAITYRLRQCTDNDIKVLSYFFKTLATQVRAGRERAAPGKASLLSKLVAFSEFWETPTPSSETLDARFEATSLTSREQYSLEMYCAFSKDNASACEPFAALANYSAAPLVYKKPQYWNTAASPRPNASVLLLSGTLDPVTPHTQAEALVAALNTTRKRLVTFEYATHGALWHTATTTTTHGAMPCGVAIVASYVQQNGDLAKLDVACTLEQSKSFTLTVESQLVTKWLSASAAYNGTFVAAGIQPAGSSRKNPFSSPYKLAFIALAVLLALALVCLCVLLVKWRRSRHQQRLTESVDYESCRD
jgi:pimeloyl-ACP methyl ester carboxylesterase